MGVSTQRSLKMRLIWTSLALVLASLWHVQGYTCPPGKSKKTITLGVGESVDFSTQDADSYGKNVKCVVKFKKAKKAKCELNFSCSAFTLTAKNSNCNRGSDFLKIGKEKFCEDNSPDVTVAGRTLNVLFRSNKRSKGGEGAKWLCRRLTSRSCWPLSLCQMITAVTRHILTGPRSQETKSRFFLSTNPNKDTSLFH